MKSHLFTKLVRVLFVAMFATVLASQAHAGPGPIYTPVKVKDTGKVNPGDKIAVVCACGAVTTMTADKDGNYLKNFTCGACKKKFVARPNAHGGTNGFFVYEDDAGHQAKLLHAM